MGNKITYDMLDYVEENTDKIIRYDFVCNIPNLKSVMENCKEENLQDPCVAAFVLFFASNPYDEIVKEKKETILFDERTYRKVVKICRDLLLKIKIED